MATEPIVAVVDDDAAVRDSLQVLLEAEGFSVEVFEGARAFLDDFGSAPGSCVLADVRMPDMDGLELLAELRGLPSPPPVIVMTGHGDVPMAVKAMKLGAVDFIEKPFQPDALIELVREVLAAAERRPDDQAVRAIQQLTPRERQVLEQLVIGRSNKSIARELGISPRTVEVHRARVMEKMHARSLPELVRSAMHAGMDPDG